MPGTDVGIGPWAGGLNLARDASLIADNELAVCDNLYVGDNGELVIRNGLKYEGSVDATVIGYSQSGTLTRVYVVIEDTAALFSIDLGKTPEEHVATALGPTGRTSSMVQYIVPNTPTSPAVYFVPRTGWPGRRQLLSDGTMTDITGMPKGSNSLIFRDRMFITGNESGGENRPNQYRIYYSATGNPESWPVNNFFDVSPGDKDYVAALAVVNDTLYIFKQRSIWTLSFDTDPFQGTLRKINDRYGATGPTSVTVAQNIAYFISDRSIYRLTNNYVEDIGYNLDIGTFRTIEFVFNMDFIVTTDEVLFVGVRIPITGSVIYRYFCCNLKNNAWSEYKFGQALNRMINIPILHQELGWSGTWQPTLHKGFFSWDYSANYLPAFIVEEDHVRTKRTLQTRFVTKEYNFPPLNTFKRLFTWGFDMIVRPQSNALNANIALTVDRAVLGPEEEFVNFSAQTVPAGQRRHVRGFTRNRAKAFQFRFSTNSKEVTSGGTAFIVYGGHAEISSKGGMGKNVT